MSASHSASSRRAGRTRGAIRLSSSDRVYYAIIHVIIALLLVLVAYPLIYVLSSSFSSPQAVSLGRVRLLPVDFSLRGYREVFDYAAVWTGYRNTIFYTTVGTCWNIAMTLCAAFALSRPRLPGKGFFMFLFTFTMLFSGGLVPTYLLMKDLRLLNSPLVMILPGAISTYNMVVVRTFMQGVPAELSEAAQIDGCSDTRYFFRILLPLSKAVIAVIALYYAVGHWNAYFGAMLYLTDRNYFPLQLILREILILNSVDTSMILDPEEAQALEGMRDLLKYALIVVSTVPILCVYPFIQRYFTKGVMIGSLKG